MTMASVGAEGPLVVVIAGPNGAGKSTTAPRLLRDALEVEEFVNPDTIAAGLSVLAPDSVDLEAARIMLRRIRYLADKRRSFAFETTLASRYFVHRFLRDLRAAGYHARLVFLSLPSADTAVARVAHRVQLGGHDVPESVVRQRYECGLRNLRDLYLGAVDTWELLDNSDPNGPRPIARGRRGDREQVLDPQSWASLMENIP